MPLIKRPHSGTVRRVANVRMEDIERLCWGYYTFAEAHTLAASELRALWQERGADLTALHAEHFAWTRCAGWWEFQAPERRRRVDGGAHPHDNLERPSYIPKTLFYGVPRMLQSADDFAAIFESQHAYLSRLKLWLPSERTVPPWQPGEDDDDTPSLNRQVLTQWWDNEH